VQSSVPAERVLTEEEQQLWASFSKAHQHLDEASVNSRAAVKLLHETVDLATLSKVGTAVRGAALFELGSVYDRGVPPISRDVRKAVAFYNESAAFGNASAQHMMAYIHATGAHGVEQNDGLSVINDYFAAIGGNIAAAMAMGYRHLYGRGVPKKCESAQMFYELAANSAADKMSSAAVPALHMSGERLSDSTNLKKLRKQGSDEVVQYYHYSAEKGDTGAQVALGQLNYYGIRGVAQDFTKAAEHFQAALDKGETSALGSLGHMYALGLGVPKDHAVAYKHFKKGAETGQAAAQNGLGYLYAHGLHVPYARGKALHYFKLAAEQGNADALFNLGMMHMQKGKPAEKKGKTGTDGGAETAADAVGKVGVEEDDTDAASNAGDVEDGSRNFGKALQYFTLAGQQSHTLAIHKLAFMHSYGLGTARSCETAVKLLKTVAERGHQSTALEPALEQYVKGDEEQAVQQYSVAALEGYEIAQSNGAWLHEVSVSSHHQPLMGAIAMGMAVVGLGSMGEGERETVSGSTRAEAGVEGGELAGAGSEGGSRAQGLSPLEMRRKKAVQLYQMAAEQGNVEANLKIGDFHYYGLGGLNTSYVKAALHYRAASDLRHPRSMFNLGYMHQYGIGLPQDLHLAKRFFDMAAETHQEATVPVALALTNLWMQRTAKEYLGIELDQWPGGATDSATGLLPRLLQLNPTKSKAGEGGTEADGEAFDLLNALETDTVVILLLVTALGVCCAVFRRRQERIARGSRR
jgi:SEL1 protein